MGGETAAVSGSSSVGSTYSPATSGSTSKISKLSIFNGNPMVNLKNIEFFGIFGNMINSEGTANEHSTTYIG